MSDNTMKYKFGLYFNIVSDSVYIIHISPRNVPGTFHVFPCYRGRECGGLWGVEIHQNQNRRDRLREVIRTIILIWNIIFIIIIFIAYREEVNQKFFPQAYQKRPLSFTTPSISFTFLFLFLHFL